MAFRGGRWAARSRSTATPLGTAFSAEQGQRLQRLGIKRLWIAHDADTEGTKATARLLAEWRPQAIGGVFDLRVITLPPGSDPDALVREKGADEFRRLLAASRHWLSWELDRLLEDLQDNPDDLSVLPRCERAGAELLAQLPRGGARNRSGSRWLRPMRKATGGRDALEPGGRLFLHSPECRDVIAQLTFRHPLHREAIGLLWHLRERLGRAGAEEPADGASQVVGLVEVVMELVPQMEAPLAAFLTSLVAGGGVVGAALTGDPGAELGVVLGVLEGGVENHAGRQTKPTHLASQIQPDPGQCKEYQGPIC